LSRSFAIGQLLLRAAGLVAMYHAVFCGNFLYTPPSYQDAHAPTAARHHHLLSPSPHAEASRKRFHMKKQFSIGLSYCIVPCANANLLLYRRWIVVAHHRFLTNSRPGGAVFAGPFHRHSDFNLSLVGHANDDHYSFPVFSACRPVNSINASSVGCPAYCFHGWLVV
jgi:hypothetical protein